jgi:sugar phosphate isomerase/epimerase
MQLQILCTSWGHEHLEPEEFISKVKAAGYDGIDTPVPESREGRKKLIYLLNAYGLSLVAHQHQASGNSIGEFCKSYEYYLELATECDALLINSHSGRDYFSLGDQLAVIDTAENFTARHGITIAHETHRGRIGFCPGNTMNIFEARPATRITADLSHWVCVTESLLEGFQPELEQAIKRAAHIHARVGFAEGPQIPDPRNAFWQKEVYFFLAIWNRIFNYQRSIGTKIFTATPEFGPAPYMWTDTYNKPVASQWDINVFMKDLIREKFNTG